MSPLVTPARHALRTIRLARPRRYGRCAQCGKPIRTRRWQPSIDRTGPVMLHRRCVHPVRLTPRGQLWVDIAVTAAAATAIVAILIGALTLLAAQMQASGARIP